MEALKVMGDEVVDEVSDEVEAAEEGRQVVAEGRKRQEIVAAMIISWCETNSHFLLKAVRDGEYNCRHRSGPYSDESHCNSWKSDALGYRIL
mgnify:CR=1 FL=1|jgi:hypothetical protein